MEDWKTIAEAPLETPGMFWSEEMRRTWDKDPSARGNYPMGHITATESGRWVVCNWRGYEFTHFHPNPEPPPHA
jgi:hypothetical protein